MRAEWTRARIVGWMIGALLLGLVGGSCGVKGPPKPPRLFQGQLQPACPGGQAHGGLSCSREPIPR